MQDSKYIVFKKQSGTLKEFVEAVLALVETVTLDGHENKETENLARALVAFNAEMDSDEPCFVLRAQDMYAPKAIVGYSHDCRWGACSIHHVERAVAVSEDMKKWQKKHPEKVKVPD